ncbi:uncharacterized protein [Macrobrachium rosenbergii]|uniref:uncharacterized protein n=1 Tax=Macrobrachium rosenbergii TaxID=79674 RepID=UPI0034D58E8B
MVIYYRRFIPGLAHTMAPLTEILKGRPKTLVWGPDQQRAIFLTKAVLAKATALAHQDPSTPLQLTADSSNLEQVINRASQPIVFFSRKLSPTSPTTAPSTGNCLRCTRRYATSNSSWRAHPSQFGQTTSRWSTPPQSCGMHGPPGSSGTSCPSRISPAPSSTSPAGRTPSADTLLKIKINAVQLGIDYKDLAQEQAADPEIPAYHTTIMSLKWKDMPLAPGWPTLLSNVSTGHPRPLVPSSRRQLVFDVIHGLPHPSSRTTEGLLAENLNGGEVPQVPEGVPMAHCTSDNWKYQLPWVLLRLRTTPRANSNPSAAEKVFGESLVVPGELITEDRDNLTTQRLCNRVGKFTPCRRTYTNRTSPFMPPGLSSVSHVFVRNDAVRPSLTRPYRGPFLILERNNKAFQVAVHSKDGWVSVDRLKPEFQEEDVGGTSQSPPQEVVPPQPTLPA